MKIPPPPADLWWVLIGMFWTMLMIRVGQWIAAS